MSAKSKNADRQRHVFDFSEVYKADGPEISDYLKKLNNLGKELSETLPDNTFKELQKFLVDPDNRILFVQVVHCYEFYAKFNSERDVVPKEFTEKLPKRLSEELFTPGLPKTLTPYKNLLKDYCKKIECAMEIFYSINMNIFVKLYPIDDFEEVSHINSRMLDAINILDEIRERLENMYNELPSKFRTISDDTALGNLLQNLKNGCGFKEAHAFDIAKVVYRWVHGKEPIINNDGRWNKAKNIYRKIKKDIKTFRPS